MFSGQVPWRCLVPLNAVAMLIGKGGANVRQLSESSGAEVSISKDGETPATLEDKIVTISAARVDQKERACAQVVMKLRQLQSVSDYEPAVFVIIIPQIAAPVIIGAKGAQIKAIMEQSGAEVNVGREAIMGMSDMPISINGTLDQVVAAVAGINGVLQDMADRGKLRDGDFLYRSQDAGADDLAPARQQWPPAHVEAAPASHDYSRNQPTYAAEPQHQAPVPQPAPAPAPAAQHGGHGGHSGFAPNGQAEALSGAGHSASHGAAHGMGAPSAGFNQGGAGSGSSFGAGATGTSFSPSSTGGAGAGGTSFGGTSFGPGANGGTSFGPGGAAGGTSFGPGGAAGGTSFGPGGAAGGTSFGPGGVAGTSFGPGGQGGMGGGFGGMGSFGGMGGFGGVGGMGFGGMPMGMGMGGMGGMFGAGGMGPMMGSNSERAFFAALQASGVNNAQLTLLLPQPLVQNILVPRGFMAEVAQRAGCKIDLGNEGPVGMRQVTLTGTMVANALASLLLQEKALQFQQMS